MNFSTVTTSLCMDQKRKNPKWNKSRMFSYALSNITDNSTALLCFRKMHISLSESKKVNSSKSELFVLCIRNACTVHITYPGTLIQSSYWGHRLQACSRPSKLLQNRILQMNFYCEVLSSCTFCISSYTKDGISTSSTEFLLSIFPCFQA